MSRPEEEERAIVEVGEFLLSLIDRDKTKRIPQAIRVKALWLLTHYPGPVRTAQLFGKETP